MSRTRSSPPSVVTVRRAGIEDAATLAALGARTFADAYRELIPEDELGRYVALSFSLEQIRGELGTPGSTFLIAERGTDAVGYARLLEDAPPGVDAAAPALRLVRIYVDHALVRGGVGGLLMQACLEQARAEGCGSLWLRVWEENHSAIAFYEKWRFAKVGTLEFDMLGEVRTDWIMQVGTERPVVGDAMANSRQIAALLGPTLAVMLVSEFPLVQPHLYDRQIPPVVYLSGVLMFTAGLTVVRLHNRWARDWTLLVTLTGCFFLVLGLVRMFAASRYQAAAAGTSATVFMVLEGMLFVVALVLSYHGYRRGSEAKPREESS